MVYKEWLTVRYKMLLALVTYTLLGVLSVIAWTTAWKTSLMGIWLPVSLAGTCFMGALGGVDLISEEKDKGTISFLLTRPVSRARIYTTKIGLNVIGLASVYGLLTLIVLGLSYLPITYDYWDYNQQIQLHNQPAHTMSPRLCPGNGVGRHAGGGRLDLLHRICVGLDPIGRGYYHRQPLPGRDPVCYRRGGLSRPLARPAQRDDFPDDFTAGFQHCDNRNIAGVLPGRPDAISAQRILIIERL